MKNALTLRPLAFAIALAAASEAHAVGTGTIAFGTGGIAKNGVTTTVTQTSDKMIVNWDNMDVAAKESLKFAQPLETSAVLNRINSANPTSILGSLTANGRVFVVNPNGVLIGKGANINVGSFVASSLDMSDADFKADKFRFTGNGTGKVSNAGDITAKELVALIGSGEVRNDAGGQIVGSKGVAMAAGGDVTLSFGDSDNSFAITLDQGSMKALINNGGLIATNDGNIKLTARAIDAMTRSVINNSGSIEAKGATIGADNSIVLESLGNGSVDIGGKLEAMHDKPLGQQRSLIKVSGDSVNILDGAQLTAGQAGEGRFGQYEVRGGQIELAAQGKDRAVKFDRSTLAAEQLLLTADNVLTGEGLQVPKLSSTTRSENMNISVKLQTEEQNLNVGGSAKPTAGNGVIDASFVKAAADQKSRLNIATGTGTVKLDNSALNYGDLALASRLGSVELNSKINGASLTVVAGKLTQAAGADINMTRSLNVTSLSDLVQTANISAGESIGLTAKAAFTQQKGTQTKAASVHYGADQLTLNGETNAVGNVSLRAKDGATQSADSSITTGTLDLAGGGFNLTKGRNTAGIVRGGVDSLDMTMTGDTTLGGIGTRGNLNAKSLGSVSIAQVEAGGNIAIKSDKDIISAGVLKAGGDITLNGVNVRSLDKEPGTDQYSVINASGKLAIDAAKSISLGSIKANNVTLAARDGAISADSLEAGTASVTSANGTWLKNLEATNATISAGKEGIGLTGARVKQNLTLNTSGDVTQARALERDAITVDGDLTYNLANSSKIRPAGEMPVQITAGKIIENRTEGGPANPFAPPPPVTPLPPPPPPVTPLPPPPPPVTPLPPPPPPVTPLPPPPPPVTPLPPPPPPVTPLPPPPPPVTPLPPPPPPVTPLPPPPPPVTPLPPPPPPVTPLPPPVTPLPPPPPPVTPLPPPPPPVTPLPPPPPPVTPLPPPPVQDPSVATGSPAPAPAPAPTPNPDSAAGPGPGSPAPAPAPAPVPKPNPDSIAGPGSPAPAPAPVPRPNPDSAAGPGPGSPAPAPAPAPVSGPESTPAPRLATEVYSAFQRAIMANRDFKKSQASYNQMTLTLHKKLRADLMDAGADRFAAYQARSRYGMSMQAARESLNAANRARNQAWSDLSRAQNSYRAETSGSQRAPSALQGW
ncbi:filamentous hemagglutinin N-terminal domain-containing protein [Paraburkholderia bonniea]|uniref:two-partner secretion domain-containing protein n=1 Tax=Paraburkholderia bonniea TaxID=2152891 RepID=UPI0025724C7E|nr:filamentous hemagglutinin N-terminal domain-containing protein [Paraburkholderia bonniea]WJF89011.1 filamentous hemagglutinin N-terminal domain-containing protein [Paraburkholderia bonniea]WJF92327.1 filamentous hemagglutinin N-terminal domain-containing protein [Paraburkholderia bonniea]